MLRTSYSQTVGSRLLLQKLQTHSAVYTEHVQVHYHPNHVTAFILQLLQGLLSTQRAQHTPYPAVGAKAARRPLVPWPAATIFHAKVKQVTTALVNTISLRNAEFLYSHVPVRRKGNSYPPGRCGLPGDTRPEFMEDIGTHTSPHLSPSGVAEVGVSQGLLHMAPEGCKREEGARRMEVSELTPQMEAIALCLKGAGQHRQPGHHHCNENGLPKAHWALKYPAPTHGQTPPRKCSRPSRTKPQKLCLAGLL